jgi:hypothetical protein
VLGAASVVQRGRCTDRPAARASLAHRRRDRNSRSASTVPPGSNSSVSRYGATRRAPSATEDSIACKVVIVMVPSVVSARICVMSVVKHFASAGCASRLGVHAAPRCLAHRAFRKAAHPVTRVA